MTKLLENIYRAVNIALVNELKMLCLRMEVDIYEVIDAAKTKPFGFQAFYPGPGLGGHCIPIDPFYLTWKAREYDFSTRFIELAGEINTHMPYFVVDRTVLALGEHQKSMKGARILVVGIAYKKDVDDMRESPSLKIIDLLQKQGARVDYHDPYIPRMPETRRYKFDMQSVPLTAENLASYDALLIVTDHTCVDYAFILKHALLVVDTRNAFASRHLQSPKVIKA
jgi:UDP-N-acetyl-D-glucosamine dehydrogenase